MFTPMTWSSRPGKWLYITGVLEILLAVGFLVMGMFIPVVRGGFILTAVILGVVGLGLVAWARKMAAGFAEANRLRAMGLEGTARVINAEQTGTTMNDNPLVDLTLEVTIPGRPPYQVQHKEWIPMFRLGTLGLGTLPVRVDPADPSKILIEWNQPMTGVPGVQIGQPATAVSQQTLNPQDASAVSNLLAQFGIALPAAAAMQVTQSTPMSVDVSELQAKRQQLLATGTPGTATITAAQDTGVDVQGERLVVLDLILNLPGRPPQTIKNPAMVPAAHVAKAVAGKTVTVRMDPANPNAFAIDWAKA
jgi:hypothetical protein